MQEEKDNFEHDIQKLREEFDRNNIRSRIHPRTSYGKRDLSKNFINKNGNNYNINKEKKSEDFKKCIKILSWKNKSYKDFINKHRNISRNNPGYLYYKENLIMNQTLQNKKRATSNKNIFHKINLNQKTKKKKNRNFNNTFNKSMKSLKNSINLNNPYMPFWINNNYINKKILKHAEQLQHKDQINNKNNLIYKTINRYRNNKNKNNLNPIKNRTLDSFDKIKRKKLIYDKSLLQKTKKIQKMKNSKSVSNLININLMDLYHNKKKKLQSINDYNGKELQKNQDDDIINKEQEKIFYQIQKNFYLTSKEIIEEPEYLEEDS